MKQWHAIKGIPSVIISTVNTLDLSLAQKVIWLPQYYDSEYYKPTIPLHAPEIYDICFFGHNQGPPPRIRIR